MATKAQLEEQIAALKEQLATLQEEYDSLEATPPKPVIRLWDGVLGKDLLSPPATMASESEEYDEDGWSVTPDGFVGFYFKPLVELQKQHLESEDRTVRLGAKLNPFFFYRWVCLPTQYNETPEEAKFVKNNYDEAQLYRIFNAAKFYGGGLPPVYADWTDFDTIFSWFKRATPVKESLLPQHKLVWYGNYGIEKSRILFEDWIKDNNTKFAYNLKVVGDWQRHAYDNVFNHIGLASQKEVFLAEHPWYEPK